MLIARSWLVPVFASLLALSACQGGDVDVVGLESGLVTEEACGTTTWDLTAGQTNDVGSVTVSNDATNVYVTYELDALGATFGTLHLWIGNSLLNLPANPQGIPVPGQFCQANGGACADASGLTSYTFVLPFSELNIVDAGQACGAKLYVVTHAEVSVDSDDDGTPDQETAFGGPIGGNGPRWWFYGEYSICCDPGVPELGSCETAFAKGDWVFTTDRKSNPENLDSLNLTKNRWGWAINLNASGESYYEIYAGAGLNKTAKATLVGHLTVDWDGTTAEVTYDLIAGFGLEEVHLYAGDASPTTIAPGQYGNLASFDPSAPSYTFAVPLTDDDHDGEVWLIAHAVVCD